MNDGNKTNDLITQRRPSKHINYPKKALETHAYNVFLHSTTPAASVTQ